MTCSVDDWSSQLGERDPAGIGTGLGQDGRWTLSDYSVPGDRVPLASVDCRLALAEVYDKVDFTRGREGPRGDRAG